MKSKLSLQLPFLGSWFVFWGGDTKQLNHHHTDTAARYAYDFVKTDVNGEFYRGGERINKKSYSFGQAILAPADGTVVEAVNTIRDNESGQLNTWSVMGNYLLIKHNDTEYSVLAHLMQHSLAVKAGDKVQAGQRVASCGNSGYSTDPHLHFHLQDSAVIAQMDEHFNKKDVALGIRAYFSSVIVEREDIRKDRILYSPVKGDNIRTRILR